MTFQLLEGESRWRSPTVALTTQRRANDMRRRGDYANTGAAQWPWSLNKAMATTLPAGSTLWLQGSVSDPVVGIYDGDFASGLIGTVDAPITVRPDPGVTAIIDGSFQVSQTCQNVIFRDLIFRDSSWLTRTTDDSGSAPALIGPHGKFDAYGDNVWFVDCVFHDLATSGFWDDAVDGGFDGCVFYNIGWDAPDRGHGHNMYTQNILPSIHRFRNCVLGRSFGWCFHAYTEGGNIQGFDLSRCISIDGKFLIGGFHPVAAATLDECHVYGNTLQLGYQVTENNLDATVSNSVLSSPIAWRGNWQTQTLTNNTVGISALNAVYVYPHSKSSTRMLANIIVYNAANANSVTVDLSSLNLTSGTTYYLHNAEDYFGDVMEFESNGDDRAVRVDMQAIAHSVTVPTGHDVALMATTFPAFGCFVLVAADTASIR